MNRTRQMKVGLSYSRCIRDIVDGKVDISDVLVIVARTDFDPRNDEQWEGIWNGYGGGQSAGSIWTTPEWAGYDNEDQFRNLTIELWDQGKLHQPRQFGAHPRRLPYYWLDVSVPDNEMENNPAVKQAWEEYQLLAGLASSKREFNDNF